MYYYRLNLFFKAYTHVDSCIHCAVRNWRYQTSTKLLTAVKQSNTTNSSQPMGKYAVRSTQQREPERVWQEQKYWQRAEELKKALAQRSKRQLEKGDTWRQFFN